MLPTLIIDNFYIIYLFSNSYVWFHLVNHTKQSCLEIYNW